jgi:hypothetical protein
MMVLCRSQPHVIRVCCRSLQGLTRVLLKLRPSSALDTTSQDLSALRGLTKGRAQARGLNEDSRGESEDSRGGSVSRRADL